ncbi:hypothetical protein ACLFMI_23710 [Pseudonocardia nantongensis]
MPVGLMVQLVLGAVLLACGVLLLSVGSLVTGGVVTVAGIGWAGLCLRRL